MGNIVEGLVVTVIGIVMVSSVLVLIAFLIYMLKFLSKPKENLESSLNLPKSEEKNQNTEIIQNEKKENDLEIIAAIIAAISVSQNVNADDLIVRSFRRVSAWTEEAINEQQIE